MVSIAVGDVKDYTGKYSQTEGNAITQGGALMVYSALGKLGNMVEIRERFDTRIAELELAYADRRQLGDGQLHAIEAGKPPVPWVPYFGGTILRSQYYIVGGITEVNYNIQSGGFDAAVSNVGGKRRTFTMNIGVDLRIIDTRSLVVLKTVSMQKQIKGEEVGVGIYRFFGNELLDLNVGGKSQEPLQLGVRTTIEQSVLELVGAITGVDANVCIDPIMEPKRVARDGQIPSVAGPAQPLPVQGKANGKGNGNGNGNLTALIDPSSTQSGGLVPQNRSLVAQGAGYELQFVTATADISPQTRSQIEKMAAEASQGKVVNYKLLSRDTENFPPLQRRELTSERINAVSNILTSLGVSASRIKVLWRPDPTDAGIRREGGGTQLIASLAIEP
ncbi:CsgG/HfaB family protein [Limnohabitans sp. 2KL-1]|uniref:CsgG/HfaB family protein n=1 Tax=Limnohabitans sp. 2KL-1 TaxID=1100699 RepID=UPI001304F454|nr:CsgG/HfaB family protein [Limnohabitans sp. 2KL-1]